MELDTPRRLALFLEVYGTLPRAGPGSTADTLRALRFVPGDAPRLVLDLGCGPGAQTLVLADALPGASILALDLLPEMVAEARRRCLEHGLDDRVRVDVGDMMAPGVDTGSQDLVWCEAAIYSVGVEAALSAWRPLLAPGGAVAFTEPVWLRPDPPRELVRWWRSEYPAITDETGVRRAVTAAGFETTGFFMLPSSSWWDDYYGPMEARLGTFRARHAGDPEAGEIAAEAETEIAVWRHHHTAYSSAFFIVRPV